MNSSRLASARAARSSYFKARKKPKRDHWCTFLTTAVPCVHVPVMVHRSGHCRISYVKLIYIWFI